MPPAPAHIPAHRPRLPMTVFDDIRLLRVTFLRGPNLWTYRSALEVWLDLGALEDWPTHRLPGFVDRLCTALPALPEHHCGVGEAGGFALLERDGESGPWLLGYGESSDAHHMSSPHPQGLGARVAMEAALERAALDAASVDYVNLHGTASQKNDEVEARVIASMFPASTRASSTKGWTGHTLGAAGIVEAVVAFIALETGLAPGTLNATQLDPCCGPQLRLANETADLRFVLSNSFGFGGSNCSLLFGRDRND